MASPTSSNDPWLCALDRFLADLSVEERQEYSNATLENLFYRASVAQKQGRNAQSVASRLQSFTAAVKQYGTALDVYANSSGLILCPLWGTLRVLLQIASAFGEYFDKLVGMFVQIGDLLPVFRAYESLFRSHQGLMHALSLVFLDIMKFCTSAKEVFRKGKRHNFNIALKLVWNPFDRQFGKVIQEFRNHAAKVENEAKLAHMIEGKQHRELELAERMEVAKERQRKRRTRLLGLLTNIKYEQQQHRYKTKRHSHTGAWFLKTTEYEDWKRGDKSRCLRLSGIPGAGKSVLVSIIVDDLQRVATNDDVAVAHHYCDYSDERTLLSVNILGSLLHQLLRKLPMDDEIEDRILKLYEDGIRSPPSDELVGFLEYISQRFNVTYLVLDGFDECDDENKSELLRIIPRVAAFEQSCVKLIVASREEALTARALKEHPCISLTEASMGGDIQSFVVDQVSSRRASGELLLQNSKLEAVITSELVTKSRGMFLWVHFQLDALCDATSDSEIKQTLEDLPDGISETYKRILAKIVKLSSPKIPLVEKILKWVLCARRPLLYFELKEAVAVDPRQPWWDAEKIPNADGLQLVQPCRNLVVLDSDDTVRFAHHTVRQYLLSIPRRTDTHRFRMGQEEEADAYLGEICITYLSFSDFEAQVIRSPPQSQTSLPVLQQIGRAPSSYVIGFQGVFVEAWLRFRGVKLERKPLHINFAQFGRKLFPPPNLLQEKYRLLDYAIENWLYHSKNINFESRSNWLWQRFTLLIFESLKTFDFRPWGQGRNPPQVPHLSMFMWAVRAGVPSLLSALSSLENSSPTLKDYWQFAEQHNLRPWSDACKSGNAGVVKLLLEVHPEILHIGAVLFEAIAHCNVAVLKYLLEPQLEKMSVIGQMGLSETEIQRATLMTRQKFREAEARSDKKLLHEAIISENRDVLEVLLAFGKEERCFSSGVISTAFDQAVSRGSSELVAVFLEISTMQLQQVDLDRAMIRSAGDGCKDVFLLLAIACRRNVVINYSTLNSAMIIAAKNGHEAIVQICLDNGVDATLKVEPGCTALHDVKIRGHEDGLRSLMEQWAGSTLMHVAAESHQPACVLLLLDKGARLESCNLRGETPLHVACKCGNTRTAQVLLGRGARVNTVDSSGNTLMHAVAKSGNVTLLQYLLKAGPSINAHDNDERTPLHVSCYGYPTAATSLSAHSADKHSVNLRGLSALDLALECNNHAMVLSLINLGCHLNFELLYHHLISVGDFKPCVSDEIQAHILYYLARISLESTDRRGLAHYVVLMGFDPGLFWTFVEEDIRSIDSEGWNPVDVALVIDRRDWISKMRLCEEMRSEPCEGLDSRRDLLGSLAKSIGWNKLELRWNEYDPQKLP